MILPMILCQRLQVNLCVYPGIPALIGCCKYGFDYLCVSHMHRSLWTVSVTLSGLLGASAHVSEPEICLDSSSLVTSLYVFTPQT